MKTKKSIEELLVSIDDNLKIIITLLVLFGVSSFLLLTLVGKYLTKIVELLGG